MPVSTSPRPPKRLLSVQETAQTLHVSTKTIRRLIERRALHVHRIGRGLRISEDDVALYLNRTRT
jgi:excisionase family DNA binding protein